MILDIERNDFPFLEKLTYLDNAATTIKPNPVIYYLASYYRNYPLNPHSLRSLIGSEIADILDQSRKTIARFINADPEGLVFNSGTTAGLNAIAQMVVRELKEDDEVIISTQEHISNITPWFEMQKIVKFKIIFLRSTLHETINYQSVLKHVTSKTKVISLAGVTNVKGSFVDFSKLREHVGPKVILICDGAQAVAHIKVDFKKWDIDFFTFSATKLYGPFGLGVLVAKPSHYNRFYPTVWGGGTYASLNEHGWERLPGHSAHEAGTPNAPAIAMLANAIEYVSKIGWEKIFAHEIELTRYCTERLKEIEDVEIYTDPKTDMNVLFNIKNFSGIDITVFLGKKDIIVRSGRQCASLLYKEAASAIRVSFGLYNTKNDVDKLIEALKSTKDYLYESL